MLRATNEFVPEGGGVAQGQGLVGGLEFFDGFARAVTGFGAAVFGSLVPIGSLGQMVSIGTLLAFVIVCGAVIILRKRRPDLPRPFKTPMVPLVPILGIVVSLGLMASLNRVTWYRLVIWLVIGMVIYFTYGVKYSKVRNSQPK